MTKSNKVIEGFTDWSNEFENKARDSDIFCAAKTRMNCVISEVIIDEMVPIMTVSIY